MYIKGFDKNLCCRGFQFEVGKTYDSGLKDEDVKICEKGAFHFCRSLQSVDEYYSVKEDNRFCEIEVLGVLVEDDNKCCSNKIRIIREITGDELDILLGKINGNAGVFNSGYYNSGNCNSGNWNSGNLNSGNKNFGNYNSGFWNSGDYNSGDKNFGNRNTGAFNKSNGNTGFFNTKEHTAKIFNADSGMTQREFYNSKYWGALISGEFTLTKWIYYTEEEKLNDKEKALIGGYLKEYTYEEACANWWNSLDDEDKQTIMSIPNFNADIFKEITGIDVNNEVKK